MTITKQQMIKAIESLPENASILDAIDSLLLVYKIQQALEQVEAGETVSHEEAKARFSDWLE